jgi:ATP synthase protein I
VVNQLVKPGRKFALQQIGLQLILVILASIISYFGWGLVAAKSALAGGLVAVIPNFVFALKAFQYAGARAAKQVFNAFTSGLKIKMVLTAILFALSFKFLQLSLLHFFTVFSLALITPWGVALMSKSQQSLF